MGRDTSRPRLRELTGPHFASSAFPPHAFPALARSRNQLYKNHTIHLIANPSLCSRVTPPDRAPARASHFPLITAIVCHPLHPPKQQQHPSSITQARQTTRQPWIMPCRPTKPPSRSRPTGRSQWRVLALRAAPGTCMSHPSCLRRHITLAVLSGPLASPFPLFAPLPATHPHTRPHAQHP